MEHYEVANLFRANWLTKEKLIEEILKPLSSVLEKQASQIGEYRHIDGREVEQILSNTYYKMQMSVELLERIYYYNERIKNYTRDLLHGLRILQTIVNRTIVGSLGEDASSIDYQDRIEFRTISNVAEGSMHQEKIQQLLLKSQPIETYLNEYFLEEDKPHTIEVKYLEKTERMPFYDFGLILNRCLNKVNESVEIKKMKETAESLIEESWDLIEEITNY